MALFGWDWPQIGRGVSRVVRGFVLLAWIAVFASVAYAAFTGTLFDDLYADRGPGTTFAGDPAVFKVLAEAAQFVNQGPCPSGD
jgi:hypothetical protein